eukprot:6305722-Amphidinium_carterae.1
MLTIDTSTPAYACAIPCCRAVSISAFPLNTEEFTSVRIASPRSNVPSNSWVLVVVKLCVVEDDMLAVVADVSVTEVEVDVDTERELEENVPAVVSLDLGVLLSVDIDVPDVEELVLVVNEMELVVDIVPLLGALDRVEGLLVVLEAELSELELDVELVDVLALAAELPELELDVAL